MNLVRTRGKYNKEAATGLSARSVLPRLGEIQMLNVSIPVTNGRASEDSSD
jgi:hypothetical protein